MNLKEKVKNLPLTPGVYLMEDSQGNIIYVGKAKNLKNRVSSYFQNSKAHSQKVKKLKANIADFNYILTDTEFEAFMLECKLIRKIKPTFNRMMKNPKSYSFILIQLDGNHQKFEITNSVKKDGKHYFGPYTSKHFVAKAVQRLKEFFKISCSNPTHKNTPCLNYSLGQCIGICFQKTAVEQYKNILNKIIDLLNGTDTNILEEIEQKMVAASLNFDFETAAKYRDTLDAICSLIYKETVIEFTEANNNIVILEPLEDNSNKLFLIKGNKVLFSKKFNTADYNMEQLVKIIKTNVLAYFKNDTHTHIEVSRNDIDEAQIIYYYLKSSTCNYIVMPDNWNGIDPYIKIEDLLTNTLGKTISNLAPSTTKS
ncbi:GIY-YIG nuclease family protein [Neobacillus sp. NPDC097160]|uniref:GIY-YIG nuclease family protein n=1 Tax=Neobacillus sp. NPDC097160 TaxID=3364298 RepID=UPI0037F39643